MTYKTYKRLCINYVIKHYDLFLLKNFLGRNPLLFILERNHEKRFQPLTLAILTYSYIFSNEMTLF